ncbi:MAG: hypothetical protein ACRD2W_05275 [Acidimicrobiales bacterium]
MRRVTVVGLLVVAVLAATACGTDNPLERTIPTTPGNNPAALPTLSVKQEDVPHDFIVSLWPNGDRVEGEVTLNMCSATYPSEALRIARRQTAVFDTQERLVLSTEAVAYQTPAATAQVFQELRDAQTNCPKGFMQPPNGDPTRIIFGPTPDRDWPAVPNVERLVFDYIEMNEDGAIGRAALVFLRRGRILLGIYVYFQPDAPPPTVNGAETVDAVTNVFATRLSELPQNVTK